MITREKRSRTRVEHGIVGKMQGKLGSPYLKGDLIYSPKKGNVRHCTLI